MWNFSSRNGGTLVWSNSSMKPGWEQTLLVACGASAVGVLFIYIGGQTEPSEGFASSAGSITPEELKAIRQRGPPAVPDLLARVRAGNIFRPDVVTALASIGPGAVPALLGAMREHDELVRLTAVRALSSIPGSGEALGPTVVTGLVKVLGDPNSEIRLAAALALRHLGSTKSQAVPALTAALRGERAAGAGNPLFARQIAAYVLGTVGSQAAPAIPELTKLLDQGSAELRQEALVAIWRITRDTNRVVPQLRRMLTQTNPVAHTAVLAAVRRIGRETRLDPCLVKEVEAMQDAPVLSSPDIPEPDGL